MVGNQRNKLDWYYREFGHSKTGLQYPKQWADHVTLDSKSNLVAEPYYLDNNDIKDLARIANSGFTISITPRSEHSKETVKIVIKPTPEKFAQLRTHL